LFLSSFNFCCAENNVDIWPLISDTDCASLILSLMNEIALLAALTAASAVVIGSMMVLDFYLELIILSILASSRKIESDILVKLSASSARVQKSSLVRFSNISMRLTSELRVLAQ
jgi:hypothetical protein